MNPEENRKNQQTRESRKTEKQFSNNETVGEVNQKEGVLREGLFFFFFFSYLKRIVSNLSLRYKVVLVKSNPCFVQQRYK